MISLQLTYNEKLQVLLLALGLFGLALIASICLASTICPINHWLLRRHERKRRRQQEQLSAARYPHSSRPITSQQQQQYYRWNVAASLAGTTNKSAPGEPCTLGPPPAYEAALRASRLQSLTGNQPLVTPDHWLQSALSCKNNEPSLEPQLDLGDYFHAPKTEAWPLAAIQQQQHHAFSSSASLDKIHLQQQPKQQQTDSSKQSSPPVMLRLWVCQLDPGELIDKMRGQLEPAADCNQLAAGSQLVCLGERRSTIARQMSIPQLFGSLMNLASATATNDSGHLQAAPGTRGSQLAEMQTKLVPQLRMKQHQLQTSVDGDTSGSMSSSSGHNGTQSSACTSNEPNSTVSSGQMDSFSSEGSSENSQTLGQLGQQPPACKKLKAHPSCEDQEVTLSSGQQQLRDEQAQANRGPHNTTNRLQAGRSFRSGAGGGSRFVLSPVGSITSRVLHMNVASFSYVKDESLISTKRHNQLNFEHFYATKLRGASAGGKQPASGKEAGAQQTAKTCQLLISICDIENLLTSSWLNARACAKLAQSSSIYVQCEILLAKPASGLLRNPLRALQSGGQSSVGSSSSHPERGETHTIDFKATIAAASMGQPLIGPNAPTCGAGPLAAPMPVPRASPLQEATFDIDVEQQQPSDHQQSTSPVASARSEQTALGAHKRTNWRHEPQAGGRPILVFQSVPKQIEQQQQLLAASALMSQAQQQQSLTGAGIGSMDNQQQQQQQLVDGCSRIDLIQFDSVFVSPILNKSTLCEGHLRLRVYSQCKYLNDTCLVELKLPLNKLVGCEGLRDNLADATISWPSESASDVGESSQVFQQQQQQQADFILNNLLGNLVTASTGLPMVKLMEQIANEQEQLKGEMGYQQQQQQQVGALTGSRLAASASFIGRRIGWRPWLAVAPEQLANCDDDDTSGASLQRSASSIGCTLSRPTENNSSPALGCESPRGEGGEWANQTSGWQLEQQRQMEQNYRRSLLVSHWLNYLVAPSYECQLVEEQRGRLVLGITYLPTSNRLLFHPHKATIDWDQLGPSTRQLAKKLLLQSDTSYLVRFLMLANGRVLKRKQTHATCRAEWGQQEAVTFDLVNVSVERPSFAVALVLRNARVGPSLALTSGSLQNLTVGGADATTLGARPRPGVQSEPESPSRRSALGDAAAVWRPALATPAGERGGRSGAALARGAPGQARGQIGAGGRDLVIGHLVLADETWAELRGQPRRQLVKQFKLM